MSATRPNFKKLQKYLSSTSLCTFQSTSRCILRFVTYLQSTHLNFGERRQIFKYTSKYRQRLRQCKGFRLRYFQARRQFSSFRLWYFQVRWRTCHCALGYALNGYRSSANISKRASCTCCMSSVQAWNVLMTAKFVHFM